MRPRRVKGGGVSARPGYVVGVVGNLRRSTEACTYGDLHVMEFDLLRPHGAAPIAVRMRGMSFSRDLFAGQIVEVRDPDPETRPVVTRRLDYPPLYNTELVSFYPGEGEMPRGLSRFWALVMLLVPIVIGGTLIALYDVFLRKAG